MGLRPADQVAPRRGRRAPAALFALAALLALVLPAVAAATTGREIVGFVNAMRAANGIPSGITENALWSSGCLLHNHYGALNGVLTHVERSAAPGFSDAGATAGSTSVLYRGALWTPDQNPFEHAPIHLHQLLAPRLNAMGAAESEGYGCATTLASRTRHPPAGNITYTYPAHGAVGWRTSEVADELPFTPGELVGIAPGATTGPYLYVLFDGPGVDVHDAATVTRARLAGPDGPVALAVADNQTPGLEGYLPVGAQLIPRERLAPGTTYRAAIAARVGSQRFTHRWAFTTAGDAPARAPAPSTATAARSADLDGGTGARAVRRGHALEVTLRCPRACLVRGIGRLSSGAAARRLPYGRAGRLTRGTIRMRFKLSLGARRWLVAHRSAACADLRQRPVRVAAAGDAALRPDERELERVLAVGVVGARQAGSGR